MSEECIAEYKDDMEGGVEYYCGLLLEDYDGDGQAAYQYAESHATWEEIPEIIVGDPEPCKSRVVSYGGGGMQTTVSVETARTY